MSLNYRMPSSFFPFCETLLFSAFFTLAGCSDGDGEPDPLTDGDIDPGISNDRDAGRPVADGGENGDGDDGDAGRPSVDGGDHENEADCASVPVCQGDPNCHFRETVEGLHVSCLRDPERNNAWYLNVEATGIPDHAYSDPMGEVWDQQWSFRIPLEPEPPESFNGLSCPPSDSPQQEALGEKGIAINGVIIFQPLSIEFVDPIAPPPMNVPEMLDYCDAHGAAGAYHYHVNPICLYGVYEDGNAVSGIINKGPQDQSMESSYERGEWDRPSGIIGFSLEGYPVWGPYADASGAPHTGLDACNGKLDEDGNYGYYVTDRFPYMIGCEGGGRPISNTTAADWMCTTNPPAGVPTN